MARNRICAGALGVVMAVLIVGYFWPLDDMTTSFCPNALAAKPYNAGFLYPVWTLYLLKAVCCTSRWAATLAGVWSVSVVLVCSGKWRTPAWMLLLAPPFLVGLFWGHPFEAFVFLGLTLVVRGHVGWGLALLAFKPQLGVVPGLYVAWTHRREWKTFAPLVLLIIAITGLDLVLMGRGWWLPFYQAIGPMADVSWNVSFWRVFRWLSLLWLPIGSWALFSQEGVRKRLFVAYLLGLLLMPYWAVYSLWPLVAMMGCWLNRGREWDG